MAKMRILYEGDLHTQITHEPTGQTLHTDAPVDNQGRGETFSPTDLVAAALASCIATVIGIYGRRKEWDLRGMRMTADKTMSVDVPRRIVKISMEIWIPIPLSLEEQEQVKKVAHTCPVQHSLHPDIDIALVFHWAEESMGGR